MESSYVISTEELAAHLAAGDVRVVDGTFLMGGDATPGHFEKRIPTAVFFDMRVIKNAASPLTFEIPTLEQFTQFMRQLGLPNDGKLVVVYDQSGCTTAPRVWLTLRCFGFNNVKVLNGGLPKWIAEGREVTSGEYPLMAAAPSEGNFDFQEHPEFRARYEEVKEISTRLGNNDNSQLLWDSRPLQVAQGGSIPNITMVPGGQAFNEDKTVKSPEEVRSLLESGGLDLSKPIVTSCGKGINASVAMWLLSYIGKADARAYLESYEEWAAKSA